MNRRNVLLGLGAVVAGGSATLGTGAFSSVDAQRSATIRTVGDAAAFLGIEAHPNRSDDTVSPNDPDDGSEGTPYLTLTGDEMLEFNFDGSGTPSIDGAGLNRIATTEFDDLIEISNQGSQDNVSLDIKLVDSSGSTVDEDNVFDAYASADSTNGNISGGELLAGSASLDADERVAVGFRFDLAATDSLDDSQYTDTAQQDYGENVDSIQITATTQ
ncbi:hypothetical protein ACFR99_06615 [Haloarchaeobius amylolyticus]|uniref:DUF1102 domain-containing protein n=2 Tax=Haloarchaeobius amylolyticus TaxID=1198296 RepID=A0ABD6BE87_9EURY